MVYNCYKNVIKYVSFATSHHPTLMQTYFPIILRYHNTNQGIYIYIYNIHFTSSLKSIFILLLHTMLPTLQPHYTQ